MGDIANIHSEVLFQHPYTPSEFTISPQEWQESIAPRVIQYLQDDLNIEAVSRLYNVDMGLLTETAGVLLAAFETQNPRIQAYNNSQKVGHDRDTKVDVYIPNETFAYYVKRFAHRLVHHDPDHLEQNAEFLLGWSTNEKEVVRNFRDSLGMLLSGASDALGLPMLESGIGSYTKDQMILSMTYDSKHQYRVALGMSLSHILSTRMNNMISDQSDPVWGDLPTSRLFSENFDLAFGFLQRMENIFAQEYAFLADRSEQFRLPMLTEFRFTYDLQDDPQTVNLVQGLSQNKLYDILQVIRTLYERMYVHSVQPADPYPEFDTRKNPDTQKTTQLKISYRVPYHIPASYTSI